MDNPGVMASGKVIGLMAGDEECFELFKELFDLVIKARHSSYEVRDLENRIVFTPWLQQNGDNISDLPIDPSGSHIVRVQVGCRQNLKGFRFGSALTKEDRCKVEDVLVKALVATGGEGPKYYPLAGSTSYAPMPQGMADCDAEDLESEHFLFGPPSCQVQLAAGVGRHWPEARGVFISGPRDFISWVNEEDHLHATTVHVGGDLKRAFTEFSKVLSSVEQALISEGHSGFAFTDRLGYLTSCLSRLGSGGMRAGATLRLPLFPGNPDFSATCRSLGVQASPAPPSAPRFEAGLWDIENITSFENPAQIVSTVVCGCRALIAKEQELGRKLSESQRALPTARRYSERLFEMTFATAPSGSFAAAYEAVGTSEVAAGGNFAFLIPGDEELFVGGGALNGAVGKLLLEKASQPIAFECVDGKYAMITDPLTGRDVPKFDKARCPYRKLHEIVFTRARREVNTMIPATLEELAQTEAPVVFAAARCYSGSILPFGAAFLSIFEKDYRPFGAARNVALLYTVGALGVNKKAEGEGIPDPQREDVVKTDPRDFVVEIFKIGRNVMQLVMDYNAVCKNLVPSQPKVEVVRVPTVGGGTFLHPMVQPHECALSLLWGLHAALAGQQEGSSQVCPQIELMPGKPMEAAYQLYSEHAKPSDWNTNESKDLFAQLLPLVEISQCTAETV